MAVVRGSGESEKMRRVNGDIFAGDGDVLNTEHANELMQRSILVNHIYCKLVTLIAPVHNFFGDTKEFRRYYK